MVFYHFHALKFYLNNIVCLSPSFYISNEVETSIYFPYIKELIRQKNRVKKIYPSFNADAALQIAPRIPYTWKDKVSIYKKGILRKWPMRLSSIRKTIQENYFYYVNNII